MVQIVFHHRIIWKIDCNQQNCSIEENPKACQNSFEDFIFSHSSTIFSTPSIIIIIFPQNLMLNTYWKKIITMAMIKLTSIVTTQQKIQLTGTSFFNFHSSTGSSFRDVQSWMIAKLRYPPLRFFSANHQTMEIRMCITPCKCQHKHILPLYFSRLLSQCFTEWVVFSSFQTQQRRATKFKFSVHKESIKPKSSDTNWTQLVGPHHPLTWGTHRSYKAWFSQLFNHPNKWWEISFFLSISFLIKSLNPSFLSNQIPQSKWRVNVTINNTRYTKTNGQMNM